MNKFLARVSITPGEINIPQGTPDGKVSTAVTIIFGIFGAVAVLVITIGAFRLILSRGNPEGLNRARNTIIYAAIGLLVTLLAYAIVNFVAGAI